MVVVDYRWSSIPMYFWFLSFTRYDFTSFVVFLSLWQHMVFTMTMAQCSYNLLGLVILPNNLTVHVPSWDGLTYNWSWWSIPWSSNILVPKSHVLVATYVPTNEYFAFTSNNWRGRGTSNTMRNRGTKPSYMNH